MRAWEDAQASRRALNRMAKRVGTGDLSSEPKKKKGKTSQPQQQLAIAPPPPQLAIAPPPVLPAIAPPPPQSISADMRTPAEIMLRAIAITNTPPTPLPVTVSEWPLFYQTYLMQLTADLNALSDESDRSLVVSEMRDVEQSVSRIQQVDPYDPTFHKNEEWQADQIGLRASLVRLLLRSGQLARTVNRISFAIQGFVSISQLVSAIIFRAPATFEKVMKYLSMKNPAYYEDEFLDVPDDDLEGFFDNYVSGEPDDSFFSPADQAGPSTRPGTTYDQPNGNVLRRRNVGAAGPEAATDAKMATATGTAKRFNAAKPIRTLEGEMKHATDATAAWSDDFKRRVEDYKAFIEIENDTPLEDKSSGDSPYGEAEDSSVLDGLDEEITLFSAEEEDQLARASAAFNSSYQEVAVARTEADALQQARRTSAYTSSIADVVAAEQAADPVAIRAAHEALASHVVDEAVPLAQRRHGFLFVTNRLETEETQAALKQIAVFEEEAQRIAGRISALSKTITEANKFKITRKFVSAETAASFADDVAARYPLAAGLTEQKKLFDMSRSLTRLSSERVLGTLTEENIKATMTLLQYARDPATLLVYEGSAGYDAIRAALKRLERMALQSVQRWGVETVSRKATGVIVSAVINAVADEKVAQVIDCVNHYNGIRPYSQRELLSADVLNQIDRVPVSASYALRERMAFARGSKWSVVLDPVGGLTQPDLASRACGTISQLHLTPAQLASADEASLVFAAQVNNAASTMASGALASAANVEDSIRKSVTTLDTLIEELIKFRRTLAVAPSPAALASASSAAEEAGSAFRAIFNQNRPVLERVGAAFFDGIQNVKKVFQNSWSYLAPTTNAEEVDALLLRYNKMRDALQAPLQQVIAYRTRTMAVYREIQSGVEASFVGSYGATSKELAAFIKAREELETGLNVVRLRQSEEALNVLATRSPGSLDFIFSSARAKEFRSTVGEITSRISTASGAYIARFDAAALRAGEALTRVVEGIRFGIARFAATAFGSAFFTVSRKLIGWAFVIFDIYTVYDIISSYIKWRNSWYTNFPHPATVSYDVLNPGRVSSLPSVAQYYSSEPYMSLLASGDVFLSPTTIGGARPLIQGVGLRRSEGLNDIFHTGYYWESSPVKQVRTYAFDGVTPSHYFASGFLADPCYADSQLGGDRTPGVELDFPRGASFEDSTTYLFMTNGMEEELISSGTVSRHGIMVEPIHHHAIDCAQAVLDVYENAYGEGRMHRAGCLALLFQPELFVQFIQGQVLSEAYQNKVGTHPLIAGVQYPPWFTTVITELLTPPIVDYAPPPIADFYKEAKKQAAVLAQSFNLGVDTKVRIVDPFSLPAIAEYGQWERPIFQEDIGDREIDLGGYIFGPVPPIQWPRRDGQPVPKPPYDLKSPFWDSWAQGGQPHKYTELLTLLAQQRSHPLTMGTALMVGNGSTYITARSVNDVIANKSCIARHNFALEVLVTAKDHTGVIFTALREGISILCALCHYWSIVTKNTSLAPYASFFRLAAAALAAPIEPGGLEEFEHVLKLMAVAIEHSWIHGGNRATLLSTLFTPLAGPYDWVYPMEDRKTTKFVASLLDRMVSLRKPEDEVGDGLNITAFVAPEPKDYFQGFNYEALLDKFRVSEKYYVKGSTPPILNYSVSPRLLERYTQAGLTSEGLVPSDTRLLHADGFVCSDEFVSHAIGPPPKAEDISQGYVTYGGLYVDASGAVVDPPDPPAATINDQDTPSGGKFVPPASGFDTPTKYGTTTDPLAAFRRAEHGEFYDIATLDTVTNQPLGTQYYSSQGF